MQAADPTRARLRASLLAARTAAETKFQGVYLSDALHRMDALLGNVYDDAEVRRLKVFLDALRVLMPLPAPVAALQDYIRTHSRSCCAEKPLCRLLHFGLSVGADCHTSPPRFKTASHTYVFAANACGERHAA